VRSNLDARSTSYNVVRRAVCAIRDTPPTRARTSLLIVRLVFVILSFVIFILRRIVNALSAVVVSLGVVPLSSELADSL